MAVPSACVGGIWGTIGPWAPLAQPAPPPSQASIVVVVWWAIVRPAAGRVWVGFWSIGPIGKPGAWDGCRSGDGPRAIAFRVGVREGWGGHGITQRLKLIWRE